MSNSKEPSFTVVDRRGSNHIHIEHEAPATPVAVESEDTRKGKRTWKSVGFVLVFHHGQQGIMPAGRAIGLRGDGALACADYFLPPIWPEHLDWVKEARRRLNTWLGCDCTPTHVCQVHQITVQGWAKEDMARLESITRKPLCEAVELVMKVEQARQNQKVVIPGR